MRISIEEKHSLVARYQAGESVSDICADSGVPKSTFYTWIKPYTVTMTDSGHAVSQQAFIKMKQKLQKLEKKIEILQKVNCTVSASLQEKLQELAKLHGQYSVHALCEALCVSRGTFYNHIFRRKEVTAYDTGLRRGELLGLKWVDIDLERGDLRVRRQIARINGEVVEAPLKTKNAYRTLPLAEDTIGVLKAQKQKTGDSPWVFPSPTGRPISPDSVLHMLHRVLKRAGLPRVRFHDLRHTFATLALQNGVDVKTVSGMLGHFSAGFTLDTYAHVTTASQRQAAKTMGSILSGSLQP